MHTVLKPFPYSHDGVAVVVLGAGHSFEPRPDLVEGLERAGLVERVEAADAAQSDAFDPTTATAEELRAFLVQRGVKPHHLTGEAKLRELAAAELAKE